MIIMNFNEFSKDDMDKIMREDGTRCEYGNKIPCESLNDNGTCKKQNGVMCERWITICCRALELKQTGKIEE